MSQIATSQGLHIGWTVRHIALPLLPFTVGALIRGVTSGRVDGATFSTEELAFSIAMLGITMLSSVTRLTDENSRSSLSAIFVFISIVFVTMYACTVLLTAQQGGSPGASPAGMVDVAQASRNAATLGRIRWFVYPAAVVSVAVAILVRLRFRLDE